MAWFKTERVIHDIEKGSNLDLLVRGFHGIGNRLVDVIGGGLHAIALALSAPHDNSEEVKKQIERLKSSRSSLAESINKHNEGE